MPLPLAIPPALCGLISVAVPTILITGAAIGSAVGWLIDNKIDPPKNFMTTGRWIGLSVMVAVVCVFLVFADYVTGVQLPPALVERRDKITAQITSLKNKILRKAE